jgi:hypothetical protein
MYTQKREKHQFSIGLSALEILETLTPENLQLQEKSQISQDTFPRLDLLNSTNYALLNRHTNRDIHLKELRRLKK